jgi:ribonuclease P protein component
VGYHFTKADRLLKRYEFLKLSKCGTKVRTDHFIAIYQKNKFKQPRLGITVTKKVGVAVDRNRIKRHIREYFRLNRHQIKGNWDINIIVNKNASNSSSQELYSSIRQVFTTLSDKS